MTLLPPRDLTYCDMASALLEAAGLLAVGAGMVAAARGPSADSRSAKGLVGAVRRGLFVSRSRKPVQRTERAKPGGWWWGGGESDSNGGVRLIDRSIDRSNLNV
jgi:hypothetical protein